jgi:hypothetical protein
MDQPIMAILVKTCWVSPYPFAVGVHTRARVCKSLHEKIKFCNFYSGIRQTASGINFGAKVL